MTTAAIYARLSDDKRKGTDEEGKTVEGQVADCRAFIAAKGWTVGQIYSDNSVSATSGAVRPAFEQMLIDGPPVVVAYRASRLSRDVMDTLRLKTAKITGYLEDGGMLDFSSGDATMLTLIRSVVDAADGEKKAEFQKRRNLEDFRAGKWHFSRPQFGNSWKDGKLIPAEAEAIRIAAKDIAAGTSTFFMTAKAWNAAGLTTPITTNGHGGRLWEPGTVRQFFQAERLAGRRTYAGETRVMAGWEPILDTDTWDQIQILIQKNKTNKPGKQGTRHNPHLLTGIAKCAMCGKGLNVGYRGGAGSQRFYRCTTPGHLSRQADKLEHFVVEKFLYLLIHSGAEQIINPDGHTSTAPLRVQRAKLVMDYDTWMDEATGESPLPPSAIAKRVRSHTEQLAALDAQLLEAVKDAVFSDLLPAFMAAGPDALWDKWATVPMPQKREIVESLYESITVHKASRSHKFDPRLITLRATPLMMDLVELNQTDYAVDIPVVPIITEKIRKPGYKKLEGVRVTPL